MHKRVLWPEHNGSTFSSCRTDPGSMRAQSTRVVCAATRRRRPRLASLWMPLDASHSAHGSYARTARLITAAASGGLGRRYRLIHDSPRRPKTLEANLSRFGGVGTTNGASLAVVTPSRSGPDSYRADAPADERCVWLKDLTGYSTADFRSRRPRAIQGSIESSYEARPF